VFSVTIRLNTSATDQYGSPAPTADDLQNVAPALEKYRQITIVGDLWKRPGLSTRDRSLPGTVHNWRADKPITPKVVWDACRTAAERAGIEKRVSAHTLRHAPSSL
jgi:integrase